MFIIKLSNCDMVLGIQWLVMLSNIISYYKDLWMSLSGKVRMYHLGGDPIKLQTIRFEKSSNLLDNPNQLAGVSLCSLRILDEFDKELHFMTTILSTTVEADSILETLLTSY